MHLASPCAVFWFLNLALVRREKRTKLAHVVDAFQAPDRVDQFLSLRLSDDRGDKIAGFFFDVCGSRRIFRRAAIRFEAPGKSLSVSGHDLQQDLSRQVGIKQLRIRDKIDPGLERKNSWIG